MVQIVYQVPVAFSDLNLEVLSLVLTCRLLFSSPSSGHLRGVVWILCFPYLHLVIERCLIAGVVKERTERSGRGIGIPGGMAFLRARKMHFVSCDWVGLLLLFVNWLSSRSMNDWQQAMPEFESLPHPLRHCFPYLSPICIEANCRFVEHLPLLDHLFIRSAMGCIFNTLC